MNIKLKYYIDPKHNRKLIAIYLAHIGADKVFIWMDYMKWLREGIRADGMDKTKNIKYMDGSRLLEAGRLLEKHTGERV